MENSICTTCRERFSCSVQEEDKFTDDITGTVIDCVHYKKQTKKYIVSVQRAKDGTLLHQMFTDELPEEVRNILSEKHDKINYQQIVDLFISICKDLPRPRALTAGRRQAIKNCSAQLKKLNISFEEYFKTIHSSDFLCRMSSGRPWKADFDFIMKPSNVLKIVEGKYENRHVRDSGGISRPPSFDMKQIERDAMLNTTIKGLND